MHIADILIHIEEDLATNEREGIVTALRGHQGVIAPRFNTDHLLMLLFDPFTVRTPALLRTVQDCGCHGRLVGL